MKMSNPVQAYPKAMLKLVNFCWLLKLIKAIPKNKKAMQHSFIISTMLESRFLKGRLRKINKAMSTDVNIRIGRAYIGWDENMPITNA